MGIVHAFDAILLRVKVCFIAEFCCLNVSLTILNL